jgi:CDGSH-type Zn-finger protein/truncated hemoglobin YjbI/ferredoxin
MNAGGNEPPQPIPRGIEALLHSSLQLETELLGPADDQPVELRAVARRLHRSVIQPLRHAIGHHLHDAAAPPDAEARGRDVMLGERLAQLARDATRLRVLAGDAANVQQAAAALQQLATQFAPADSDLRTTLCEIQAGLEPQVQCQRDGPYLVTNAPRLVDWLGQPLPALPQMALCRCGASKLKPFCDGTHTEIGFRDAKDPHRVPDRRDVYPGQQVTIVDNRGICQHSGQCTDRLANVFRAGQEPFVAPSGGRMDEVTRAVRACPSGALSYAVDGVEARAAVDHHGKREPTIEVTKNGPYRIVGAIPLYDGDGQAERRARGSSREHYALCRCGHSQNKPFCSGMHWNVEFQDPIRDPDQEATIFEWAGGYPALLRMTRIFYEKYVPEDPLLAPLFANMAPDHPERVAQWLGEVFGGPRTYSDEHGGYSRMLSQHIGKGLTQEKRARWVHLIIRSASEAGLPADPEFRSAFSAYIEWGSRLALENSQPRATPPEHMPMPHWDWHTAAGAPGSRTSAVQPTAEKDRPVVLPQPAETVSFNKHIQTMFRDRDRQSMKFAFDLWAYDDIKRNAPAILERVHSGSMPCDGSWPQQYVDIFARWIASGMSP